jgi:hypothetical protein
MPTWIGERIFPRGVVSFAKFLFLPNWFAKLYRLIVLFCQNYMNAKLVCQIAGDDDTLSCECGSSLMLFRIC